MSINEPSRRAAVEAMLTALDGIAYRGVPLGQSLKVDYHTYVRQGAFAYGHWRRNSRPPAALTARAARGLAAQLRSRKTGLEDGAADGQVLAVCDHGGHIVNLVRPLLADFERDEILLLMRSREVASAMVADFAHMANVRDRVDRPSLSLLAEHLKACRTVRARRGAC